MAISIAWLLDKLGNKLYAWSTTKAVMDFDRGGGSGQTLEKTLNDGLIQEYTCVTQGITHALTGTGNNIKFVADAPFNEGDTITVNGSLVSAYTQDGEALTGGAWNTGMTVVCYLDGSTLNFKGGGGKVTVTGLSAEVIVAGNTIIVKQGNKIIENIPGEFDVLLCYGWGANGQMQGFYWNGSDYISQYEVPIADISFSGKAISVTGYSTSSTGTSVCGVTLLPRRTPFVFTKTTTDENILRMNQGVGQVIVFGKKQ